ncbi:MAG: TIM barrel protein [Mucilaginibacter polytrichastri]|nr:TIM barrel protein [Mucilaginibacter polytrichastri]
MKRGEFIRNTALAGVAMAGGIPAFGQKKTSAKTAPGKTFNLDYAPHDGMFENSAGKDFLDQIRYMHDQGFRSIEDNGFLERTVTEQEKIGALLTKLNMRMGVFVISLGDNTKVGLTTGKQEFTDDLLVKCRKSVEAAKRCNAKWATVVPGAYDRKLPIDIQTANMIVALQKAADVLEKSGLIMVLEPLSDSPEQILRLSTQTYMICKAVKSPSCKILYDMYHMQKNEGNMITHMDMCWDEIAYIQIGDNPGRNEPGTGEMNYRNIFKHIHEKGYKGVMGMEHGKSQKGKEGEVALIKAYREADSFI